MGERYIRIVEVAGSNPARSTSNIIMKNLLRLSVGLSLLFSLIGVCLSLGKEGDLKEALFYQKLENKGLQCHLCPRNCLIPDGGRGFCGVRENRGGRLYSLSYAKAVSVNDIDPIEKKPLFHFFPGSRTFSIATAGCNLRCKFCQNWQISQAKPEEVEYEYLEPPELVKRVKASGRPTLAYTYTEPTIFYEYMLETAELAKAAGIKNVMHSAGYINEEPLRRLAKFLDAANIDLKGFSNDYYSRMSEGTLEPVLKTLKLLKEEGVHLEITNLVLPGYNDDSETIRKMCLWIKENLGADTPVHFSRFFPMYKLISLNPTPVETLEKARKVALECGLKYVYIGNVAGHPGENTYCPKCKNTLIERRGYFILQNNIKDGKCKFCGEKIAGVWDYIKQPNAAGAFYPDNPEELSSMIDGFLAAAEPQTVQGEIFALVSPHAGYGFSGPTAAFGYKLIKGKPYKTVIVIGTSHHYGFSGASVYPEGAFRMPLGDLEVDKEFTQQLLNKDEEVIFQPRAFENEHSVEVQLPFLQKVLANFKIVPIVMGDCSLSTCKKLAELLKVAIGNHRDILVVASTDMYHGYDYDELEAVDNLTLSYLKNMDAEGLYYGLREGKLQLCGGFGVVSALILAKELGHKKLEVLKHTNSAIVTGKLVKGVWTVGYASCAIDQEETMLNKEQKIRLLEIARKSIETYLTTGKKMEVAETDPALLKEMGAFVTLNEHGQLRGCIGNIVAREPLYLIVRDMAVEAATGDPRFPQVDLSELKTIEIEISVLSPLERIDSADKIKLGAHGVLIKKGFNSGVFLPQVATETGWSKEEFLSNLCAHKAGLPADAWKDKSTELYIFSAEVFSEKEMLANE